MRDLLRIAAEEKQVSDAFGEKILTKVGLSAEKYLDREVSSELLAAS